MIPDVVIVGGGLAGLACAMELEKRGISWEILEASDNVGGRVRTDVVDGFRLDRGFQVLLTAYPEAQRVLDYDALKLKTFVPGAMVRAEGKFRVLADPLRHPSYALSTATAGVGNWRDKVSVARLSLTLRNRSEAEFLSGRELSTGDYLRGMFSREMIEQFFRPFFSGVFLESELRTPSRVFKFLFKMFATGATAIPAGGMGEIPKQMLVSLSAERVRTGAKVVRIDGTRIQLASGVLLNPGAVVVATGEMRNAGGRFEHNGRRWRGTTCMYFAAERAPIEEPMLVLNGQGYGPVNHLAVMSNVSPDYAPPGASLISANIVGVTIQNDRVLENQVRAQLTQWFGRQVAGWRMLKIYRIPHALPETELASPHSVRVRDGVYVCGDHLGHPSIQGALESGRRAAEALAEDAGVRAA